ncbi:MAG TPA: hypothetical protein VHQ43_08680 [Solirubrobacterales bacterium]|nr:hypothetical protein [Solirubrobacterales bacterium]
MTGPLKDLAEQLRREDTPISPHVVGAIHEPSGPRGERAPVVESVREGYLLHYGESRLLAGQDDDLALLAGDYLYALGIERLAASGDVAAVEVIADLIAASARCHAEGRESAVPDLWRAAEQAIKS